MQNLLRVTLVGPSSELPGGIATVTRQWLRAAAARDDVALTEVVTMAGGGRAAKAFQAVAAARELLGGSPDVVHVHVGDGASIVRKAALLEAVGGATPVVAHLHLYDPAAAVGSRALDAILRRADRVLVLSQAMADAVGDRCPDRLEILPNAVDVERFSPLVDDDVGIATSRLLWPHDAPTLLFVGALEDRKGLPELLQAHARAREAVPNLRLRLAGPGTAPDAAGVEQLGTLDDDALVEALRAATIVCLPSRAEGVPMTLLEAMACGCAIVTTPVGGVAETVEGGAAVLVPPRDPDALAAAIVGLLGDPGRVAELRRDARRRAAERHALAAQLDRVVSLWGDLAARGPGA